MNQARGERLQKALAQLGLASRRDVEAWIRSGRLTVNGRVAMLGTRVLGTDRIRLDGRLVHRRAAASPQVLVCHRSPGEWLDRPQGERPALLERLPRNAGLRFVAVSPLPHQDGGLELVTSDGELALQLQRAVRTLVAEFSVRLRGELSDAQLEGVRAGTLDRGARLEVQDCEPGGGEGANRWYSVTVRGASGKDIRRLFEHTGALVSRVLRTRLGAVALDRALGRGQFRKLDGVELEQLLGADPVATARRTSRR
ncbi:MAG: S4 domain-containing protein [Steroidobacteraceae bacterium]